MEKYKYIVVDKDREVMADICETLSEFVFKHSFNIIYVFRGIAVLTRKHDGKMFGVKWTPILS